MDIDFLKELLHTPSLSGFETGATDLFCNHLSSYASKVTKDPIGNALAFGPKIRKTPTMMLEAHIDEIGMQVLYIDKQGYIYVRRTGSIDLQCLPGSQVTIYTKTAGEIVGVIGKKPVHLMNADEKGQTIDLEKLWVDTGMPMDSVKNKISAGDPVILNADMFLLGENVVTSRGLDDKIGVFAVTEAFKRISRTTDLNYSICAAAFVQEELGNKGAFPGTYHVQPDFAICIDVDFATDIPDCPPQKYGNIRLGDGVIIQRTADSDPAFIECAIQMAKENKIPYQVSARPHSTGGTDTCKIQLSRGGIKTLGLGIPCRYMHTPVEVCDLRDVEAAIGLMTLICSKTKI